MKKSRIVGIVGGILIVIGIYALIGAFPSSSDTMDFTIPSGNYYYFFQSDTLINGGTHGDFSVTSGGPVVLKVFTESAYKDYQNLGVATALFETSGSTGSFDVSLGGTGRIVLVFEHMSDTSEATVNMHVTLTGISFLYLIAGIVLIAIGVVVGLFAARMNKKEAAAAPQAPSPVATDVTILKKQ